MTPAELMLRRYAAQGLVAEAGRMALDYFGRKESLGVTMKGAAQTTLEATLGDINTGPTCDNCATPVSGDPVASAP